MITGSPTSVRAVLMNLSQREGLPFQQVITRYLQLAILQTFRQRDTVFVENHPFFIDEFYENQNRQTMWKAFLRKIKHPENLDFSIVVKSITERLYPIYLELENKTK